MPIADPEGHEHNSIVKSVLIERWQAELGAEKSMLQINRNDFEKNILKYP